MSLGNLILELGKLREKTPEGYDAKQDLIDYHVNRFKEYINREAVNMPRNEERELRKAFNSLSALEEFFESGFFSAT